MDKTTTPFSSFYQTSTALPITTTNFTPSSVAASASTSPKTLSISSSSPQRNQNESALLRFSKSSALFEKLNENSSNIEGPLIVHETELAIQNNKMDDSTDYEKQPLTAATDEEESGGEQSSLQTSSSPKKKKGDYNAFVFDIPPKFEELFEAFDNFGIRICQFLDYKPVVLFSLAMTAITTIEFGIALPFIFFALGLDDVATLFLYMAIPLAILPQIPKRFIWRSRPYVAGRAKKLNGASTSSFPSRAVTCSVLYSFQLCIFIRYYIQRAPNNELALASFWVWTPIAMVIWSLLTSFARVNLGVHYPSDCLFGSIQGLLVIGIGFGLYFLQSLLCPVCFFSASTMCHANSADTAFSYKTNWSHLNYWVIIILTVMFMGLCILFVIKPIYFYTKFHHVFGMVLPCITFQFTFLCKKLSFGGQSALFQEALFIPKWYHYLFSIGVGVLLTLFGLVFPKGPVKSVIGFGIMYMGVLTALGTWRLGYV